MFVLRGKRPWERALEYFVLCTPSSLTWKAVYLQII